MFNFDFMSKIGIEREIKLSKRLGKTINERLRIAISSVKAYKLQFKFGFVIHSLFSSCSLIVRV